MILLDTHIWLRWIIDAHDPLPTRIIECIQSEERVVVSAISCWEVIMLEQRKRLQLPIRAADWIERALQPAGIERLAVTCAIATRAAGLPQHHKDPADRLIIATAIEHQVRLCSLDSSFRHYVEIGPALIC